MTNEERNRIAMIAHEENAVSEPTDRELLEFAAKASGIDASRLDLHPMNANSWNPLTDDGDALRLAVKLNLDIDQSMIDFWGVESITDPYAATRRAIVRAAAEIGRNMHK